MTNNSPRPDGSRDSPAAVAFSRPAPVLAAFAALSVLMTWPLAWQFTSSLPFGSGDLWQNYWNFWWWKKALLELQQSPYFTDWLFFPNGTEIIFHTHSPFNMLVALPVTVALGPAAAYNFCLLLALTLSGYGAWLLARELGVDGRGAFLAGLVFAFFPQHLEQTLEHLNLFSTQFLPLALVWFFRAGRDGGRRNAVLFGVFFALNALCSWHLGLKLILTLIPLAAWQLWKTERSRKSLARDWAIAAAVAAIVMLPFVIPMFGQIVSGATYYGKPVVDRGIDPTYLLTPQFSHPVWGGLVIDSYLNRAYQASGFICYLGFSVVGLAVLALARRRPYALFWGIFSLITLIFALGSPPFWAGKLVEGLTLPFAVLDSIPLFRLLRVANRFLILTSLGLGMLAALGWSAFRKPTDGKFVLLAVLIVFEYLWLPFPVQPVQFSPLFSELAKTPSAGGVLDIPFNQRNLTVHNMAEQTVHGRKISGGYLSTFPPAPLEFIESDPVLSQLSNVPKLQRPIDFDHLRVLGFETVILRKYRYESYGKAAVEAVPREQLLARKEALRLGGIPDEIMNEIRRQLELYCGKATMEDDLIAVFDLKRKK